MSDPKTSERMGTVRLPGYEFLAHSAKMWRYPKEDDDGERTGWHFRILTGVPFVVADRDGSYLFSNGFRIDAEDEPIPLPDVDDLTGVEVGFESPYAPESGEPYFSFMAGEWGDIGRARLRFIERSGSRYRIEFLGIAEGLFEVPTEVRYDGWIDVVEGPS